MIEGMMMKRTLLCVAAGITLWSGACAATPEILSAPDAAPPFPSPSTVDVRGLVLTGGERFIDRPYISPPRPPESFDCSGFVRYLFGLYAGLDLPSVSGGYMNAGVGIDFGGAEPGDILIFSSAPGGSRVNHVAILYRKSETGELRGSWLLHAVSVPTWSATIRGTPGVTGVKISELGRRADGRWQEEYFLSRFLCARRVINE
jgi:cell wall-associated NlpC family hydrolase